MRYIQRNQYIIEYSAFSCIMHSVLCIQLSGKLIGLAWILSTIINASAALANSAVLADQDEPADPSALSDMTAPADPPAVHGFSDETHKFNVL